MGCRPPQLWNASTRRSSTQGRVEIKSVRQFELCRRQGGPPARQMIINADVTELSLASWLPHEPILRSVELGIYGEGWMENRNGP